MEAAKALSCSPAALDLFTWLSYRCFVAKGRERVPLFGDSGLVSQLGSADYSRPPKFRERLEGWLNLVWSMWPECPAVIDSNGTGPYVDRANAVLPNGGMGLNEQTVGTWRLSLEQIETTVADHPGKGRVPGNQPGPCFSRQFAIYLAKNVAG